MKMQLNQLRPGDVFKWGNGNATFLQLGLQSLVAARFGPDEDAFYLNNATNVEVVEHNTTFGNVIPGTLFRIKSGLYIKTVGKEQNAIELLRDCWCKDTIADDVEVTVVKNN